MRQRERNSHIIFHMLPKYRDEREVQYVNSRDFSPKKRTMHLLKCTIVRYFSYVLHQFSITLLQYHLNDYENL